MDSLSFRAQVYYIVVLHNLQFRRAHILLLYLRSTLYIFSKITCWNVKIAVPKCGYTSANSFIFAVHMH